MLGPSLDILNSLSRGKPVSLLLEGYSVKCQYLKSFQNTLRLGIGKQFVFFNCSNILLVRPIVLYFDLSLSRQILLYIPYHNF